MRIYIKNTCDIYLYQSRLIKSCLDSWNGQTYLVFETTLKKHHCHMYFREQIEQNIPKIIKPGRELHSPTSALQMKY